MEPTYRQCPFCSRKYDLDGWRRLEFHSFHEFGADFLELRTCRCKILISVLHVLKVEVKAIAPYKAYTQYEGNRIRF